MKWEEGANVGDRCVTIEDWKNPPKQASSAIYLVRLGRVIVSGYDEYSRGWFLPSHVIIQMAQEISHVNKSPTGAAVTTTDLAPAGSDSTQRGAADSRVMIG